jgi:hypothetical protein
MAPDSSLAVPTFFRSVFPPKPCVVPEVVPEGLKWGLRKDDKVRDGVGNGKEVSGNVKANRKRA